MQSSFRRLGVICAAFAIVSAAGCYSRARTNPQVASGTALAPRSSGGGPGVNGVVGEYDSHGHKVRDFGVEQTEK